MQELLIRRCFASLLAAALVGSAGLTALAGCERPLVDPLEVEVVVVSPSLETVLTDRRLVLELQALRGSPTTTLRIEDQALAYDPVRGVYTDTLDLQDGLNAIPVEVRDGELTLSTDTLYALVLDVQPGGPSAPLSFPDRAWATPTQLPDGRTFVAGGYVTSGQAQPSLTRIDLDGSAQGGMLRAPRAGHSATLLPTGEVLLLGGATSAEPDVAGDFVTTAEIFSPAGTSQLVPVTGSFRRAGHATRFFEVDGRALFYVYGGLDATSAAAVRPTGTVAVLELLRSDEGAELRVLTPPSGAGSFPPAIDPVLLDVAPPPAATAAATALPGDGSAFQFVWRAPGTAYPLDLSATLTPEAATAARSGPARVDLRDGIVLLLGGRTPDGQILGSMVAFAPAIGRSFLLPPSVTLAVPRWRASATILASRRILIGGGVTRGGAVTNTSETFTY